MSDSPAISVVMVVHNSARGLPRTLDGLRAQTMQDFELIIFDNGSTDRTWEILCGLERPRLYIHRNRTYQNPIAVLGRALERASGEYIAHHEAEDVSAPERFARQAALLRRRKDVAAVRSAVDWVDEAGRVIRHVACPTQHRLIVSRLRQENCFTHGSVMVRREALEAAGGYRAGLSFAADYDLWLRLADTYRLAGIADTLYTVAFSPRMSLIAHHAEYQEYALLARQLAAERGTHGSEQTDADAAASAVAARFARMNFFARRAMQARNYLTWAGELSRWGGPAADHVSALWQQAVIAWPFSPQVWEFTAERRQ